VRTPTRVLTVLLAGTVLTTAACTTEVPGRAGPAAVPSSPSITAPSAPGTDGTGGSGTDTPAAGAGPIEGGIPRPSPGGAGAGTVPDGLTDFYAQALEWQDCAPFNANPDYDEFYAAPGLECANLIVPLDYADPAGPTVALAVIRAAATGTSEGAVQINPGGPGASSLDTVAAIATQGSAAALQESFDLVGFDTRGVGASRPQVECRTDAQTDADRAANHRTTTPEGIAAADAALDDYVASCVANTGADAGIDGTTFLENIGTANTVRDMDVLRSALGEEQLTYLGFSYGTLLGSVYADEFPANVRAMVLDGAVDPNADSDQRTIDQNAGFQGAFEAFAAWCAQQASCPLAGDPAQATADFQALVRPLLDTPLELRDGRVLTFDDATTGLASALYSQQAWPTLRTALIDLADGDGFVLMALADQYEERDSEGHYSSTQDVFNAVRCVDSPRDPPGDTDTSLEEKATAAAPVFDNGDPVVAFDDTCSRWPGTTTLDVDVTAAPDLATLVVISTTGDPATPYAAGQELAKLLNARLITVEGDQHTAYLGGIDCVDDAVNAYLTDLALPEDGLVCP
jgi:pimeloyl-ACP methyl ester carboxylesterase